MPHVTEKMIMYEAPEAAIKVIKVILNSGGVEISHGFLSVDNRFFSQEEHARYQSCTHKLCSCGEIMGKFYTRCNKCQSKKQRDAYFALPLKEWDGNTFLCIYNDDKYFFSDDEIIDYCEEQEINAEDLMLCICEPQYLWKISSEIWDDILPEDNDVLPKEVEDAITYLNVAIGNANPISWSQGKCRTTYKYAPTSISNQAQTDERSVATDGQSEKK